MEHERTDGEEARPRYVALGTAAIWIAGLLIAGWVLTGGPF